MAWSSKSFYASQLVADSSVATHLLKDLPGVRTDENTGQEQGCQMVCFQTKNINLGKL
jgi:hypothetical protein